jgi:hypothetical protein
MKTIQLLDGNEYNKQDLLKKMVDDDFYYGELSQLVLSSSSLKLLLSSPKTYKYVTKYGSKETQPLRDGRLIHLSILEPDKFQEQIFVNVASKNSKAYKEAKDKYGLVYTRSERENAERIADAFFKNEQALKYITDCEFEVPAIDTIHGYPFRGKADVLSSKGIVDIKTTTDIKGFPYSAKKYSYDVQCYLYCHLYNKSYEDFTFLVIDKGSLDIGVWKCSEEFYLEGKRKTEQALAIFENFFIQGHDLDNYIIEGIL